MGTHPQTSLNINSRGVKVLWVMGPNDKCDDFPNGQVWHWKCK